VRHFRPQLGGDNVADGLRHCPWSESGGRSCDVSNLALVSRRRASTRCWNCALNDAHAVARSDLCVGRCLRSHRARYLDPRFSRSGRYLAFGLFDGLHLDVYVYDWSRDELARLTFDPTHAGTPVWTPDDLRIAFGSKRGDGLTSNIFWQRVDGAGQAQRLTTSNHAQAPGSWHPDGRTLAFTETDPVNGGSSIMMLRLDGDETSGWRPQQPSTFLAGADSPMFSPDGRWLADRSSFTRRQIIESEWFRTPPPAVPFTLRRRVCCKTRSLCREFSVRVLTFIQTASDLR